MTFYYFVGANIIKKRLNCHHDINNLDDVMEYTTMNPTKL